RLVRLPDLDRCGRARPGTCRYHPGPRRWPRRRRPRRPRDPAYRHQRVRPVHGLLAAAGGPYHWRRRRPVRVRDLILMALFPLPVLVELLINGTWTDITRHVYLRDPVAITGGKTQEGDKAQPAQCTMTLNNRDGRFSPSNASGAYYPYLLRNIQLRVSVVAAQSSSGNSYTGYRFWGEVSTWPPLSDISGNDVYVQIVASGP